MGNKRNFTRLVLILIFLLPLTSARSTPLAQDSSSQDAAKALLERLTPEERVGQLFLVTFSGPEAGPSSENRIYDLIAKYHIGGVILKASNDNFLAHDQTLPIALSLNRQLQTTDYAASLTKQISPSDGSSFTPAFIPLFIGIAQEGDGSPYDQILSSDMTQLPSQMTIGATWQPELASEIGTVLGKELSSLGFNLLLGPSLDVLESVHPESTGDLGVRTFGGDPFWVAEMGKAFTTGVHQGSNGEMAVISKHFPGYGSSDRLPEDEVATVRKSMNELQQVDLYPFFSVTGNAPSDEATTDGLLVSHIRYQGLQGNIRSTTKPISLDPQALDQLMSLPELKTWQENGGVMVTDDLGGQAIRRFYDSTGQTYIGRYVARDAFLAGNDLLYLGNIISEDDPDLFTSIVKTLDFFTQKYREDAAFAERVDQSVIKILTLKYRIYKNIFSLSQVRPPADVPGLIGKSGQLSFDVIKQSATILSPPETELNVAIPEPPGRNDRIVFITDLRYVRQCTACPLQPQISQNALEMAVIRLYSSQAGGQVLPGNLVSYSFNDLQEMLNVGTGIVEIENDIRQANWVVFLMMDENPDYPDSYALRNFLSQRPDLIQDKRIIVYALNVPYYLDATEVSKLTAYYALYTKIPESVNVAARLLFQEIRPTGYLPVSVDGVGYELSEATAPDRDQTIPLLLDYPDTITPTLTLTPGQSPAYQFKLGDYIPVRTGVILDQNGHQVPDNTVVQFIVTQGNEQIINQIEAQTLGGVARTTFRVDAPGNLTVSAKSPPAETSDALSFDIPAEEGEVIPPTVTSTPTATQTPEPTLTITPTQTPSPTPVPVVYSTTLGHWFLSSLLAICMGLLAFWIGSLLGQIRWRVRGGFLTLIGGLTVFLYLSLGWPGSENLIEKAGGWGIAILTLAGCLIGWGITWIWRFFQQRAAP